MCIRDRYNHGKKVGLLVVVKTILYRRTMALGTSIDMCLDLAGNGSAEVYDEGDRNLADGQ